MSEINRFSNFWTVYDHIHEIIGAINHFEGEPSAQSAQTLSDLILRFDPGFMTFLINHHNVCQERCNYGHSPDQLKLSADANEMSRLFYEKVQYPLLVEGYPEPSSGILHRVMILLDEESPTYPFVVPPDDTSAGRSTVTGRLTKPAQREQFVDDDEL